MFLEVFKYFRVSLYIVHSLSLPRFSRSRAHRSILLRCYYTLTISWLNFFCKTDTTESQFLPAVTPDTRRLRQKLKNAGSWEPVTPMSAYGVQTDTATCSLLRVRQEHGIRWCCFYFRIPFADERVEQIRRNIIMIVHWSSIERRRCNGIRFESRP